MVSMVQRKRMRTWTYEDVGCFHYGSNYANTVRTIARDAGCYYGWRPVSEYIEWLNTYTLLPEGHAFGLRFDDFAFGLWPCEVLA